MEAFLVATLAVGLAEVGDKTQTLAALRSARDRKPAVLCLALIAATLFNNVLAGALAEGLRLLVRADALPWTLCICLIGLAAWSLNAERYDDKTGANEAGKDAAGCADDPAAAGGLSASFKTFFLNGLGGKAQIAAGVLALHSAAPALSVAGATLGVFLAGLPAALLGERLSGLLPARTANLAHWGAALIYAALAYVAVTKGGIALWFLTGKATPA